jgi:hypothetical protein
MKNSCAFRNRKCVRKPNSVPRQEAPQAQTTVCHLFTIFSGQLTKSAPALNQSIETGPFSECPDVERSAPVDCTARIASAVVPRDGCFRVLGSLLLLRRAKRHKSSGASGPSVAVTLVPSVGLIGQKLDPSPRQCVATFSRVAERAAPSRRGSHAASCFLGCSELSLFTRLQRPRFQPRRAARARKIQKCIRPVRLWSILETNSEFET